MKNRFVPFRVLVVLALCWSTHTRASLGVYDSAIASDAAAGLVPVALLTNAVTLTGANRAAFDFGANSGDVTMEFVLEGNSSVGTGSAYLAVGANSSSNLRYEQYNNTGQLGFTQLGVADYLFTPIVPSPSVPTHIAYVWSAATRTMTLYLNGSIAGTSSGVSANFAMPAGVGWLGANPGGGEAMTGTIYRVTVYDDIIPSGAIERHSDAYNGVARPPIILSFMANPSAVFAPNSSTLTWNVQRATALFINGLDVTGASNLVVFPTTNTTYTLLASNAAGVGTQAVAVQVNPSPVINSFSASRTFIGAGEGISLNWNVSYGQSFFITPSVGDVAMRTINGIGSTNVHPVTSTTYTLTAGNAFGVSTASVPIHIVQPADHLVISEFMADNESTLTDQDGDFEGWIEIHNPTAGAINLAGHFLTDDEANPTKWAFPAVDLAPSAYLVVFASGKDRTDPAMPLHTNFRLNNEGEYLALVGPGPFLLHAFAPAFPPQRADVSYGLLGDDVGLVRYLGVPTPGSANNETPAPPAPVQFSIASGFFTNGFNVSLSADPNATVLYTRDGSTPSATNGIVFSAPLNITNTTHLRAAALVSNQISRISSASYVRLANDLAGYTSSLPILVIENFGAGPIPQKGWSGTGAGIKQVPRQSAAWATFSLDAGASAFTNPPQMFSDIGIRGRGAFSSTWRQKPYSVEALDATGDEHDVSPLDMPKHSEWVLYFPDPDDNKDPTLLFNTFPYELSEKTGHYAVRFRWVEAFINEDGGDLRLADRRGVYAIVEKVSRGKDRLDFQKLSEDGTTGSWLLNLNRMDPEPETGWPAENGTTQPQFFHTAGPNRILQTPPNSQVVGDDEPQQSNGYLNFDNPNGYTINANQRTAIENWFKQFEDVLWNDALWRNPVEGYRKFLDPVDFADYFVLNTLTRNGDGLLISMFPWKGDDGKLRMGPAWDYNWSAYYISGGPTGTLLHRPDRLWYRRLFADPDFLQLYIDRWWDMRRGAMSDAGMDAIIDGQSSTITPEKALLNGLASAADWTNRLGQMKTWLKARASWIDGNYLRPPAFNVNGGEVPDGFQAVITGTNGIIYFTTDGADPRAPGGAVAASAQAYQLPVAINAQTLVQARIKNGTNWSGLTAAVFRTPQDFSRLVVTEIMYNPPALGATAGDEFEFLELKNVGTNTLSLGGLTFTAGISFTFTNGTLLGPGQFFVLVRNTLAFQTKYPGVSANGIYTGRLDNGGETIRLSTPLGDSVLSVAYNDRAPWPLAADGYGFSIVPQNAFAPDNSDDGTHWRASNSNGGSPGADDPPSSIARILINEVLTHTDPPLVDAIELFNPTPQGVDIGGWFLSDDGAVPGKFRVPDGTIISAGGYVVFTETNFNPTPPTLLNFSLDSAGDALYLTSADASGNLTGYSHGLSFGAAASGVSFGRYVNSVGEEQFPAQLTTTFGSANSGPAVGPVVISEIMYHPDASGDEFIELRNVTVNDIPLFDPAFPTNTWRVNGLGFALPTNVFIPSNGFVLIVATNPASFRAKYSVPDAVPIIGPYIGVLQHSGERLELQRPDAPSTNGSLAYVTVDEVRYNDKAPWPPGADGGGPSLQRRVPGAHGNDPINWTAAASSPGSDLPMGDAPMIISQPEGRIVVAGSNVTFTVGIAGPAPLSIVWRFNGTPIAGASSPTLVLSNVQVSQAGAYRVDVFNAAGSATSVSAVLTVLAPVTFTLQPIGQDVQPGTNLTLTVSAVGHGTVRYQWRLDGTNIPGATNAAFAFTNASLANHGTYSVFAVDDISSASSSNAFIYVLVRPGFVQQPQPQTILQGQTAAFSVVVTGAPPIWYRWIRAGTPILTNDVPVLVLTNCQAGTTIRVAATNRASGTGGLNSQTVQLTVLADNDADGMADDWERQFGFNTNNAADAFLDLDGDGMINRDEYVAGTDPTSAASYLKLESLQVGGGVTIVFNAVAAHSYAIEFTDQLQVGTWSLLTNIASRSSNHVEQAFDTNFTPRRFYRLVTPSR
jgi:hypothetical protein